MDDGGPEYITVCAACYRACCWQGSLMCDNAKHAGTLEKSRHDLAALKLEDPMWWELDRESKDAERTKGES